MLVKTKKHYFLLFFLKKRISCPVTALIQEMRCAADRNGGSGLSIDLEISMLCRKLLRFPEH